MDAELEDVPESQVTFCPLQKVIFFGLKFLVCKMGGGVHTIGPASLPLVVSTGSGPGRQGLDSSSSIICCVALGT